MAEHFGFFDPVEVSPGVWDREYFAQQFTDFFRRLITTGVMKGEGKELVISTNGSNMITTVDVGVAYVVGRSYENDSLLNLTHDTETLGKNRIDRIVVRLDLNTEARHVKSFIKKGVASTNPVPPALTRNNTVYEISLAQVKIIGGQTYINKADVTDERGTNDICPWAGSKILPNFDDAALQELINSQLTDGGYTRDYSVGHLDDLMTMGFYSSEGLNNVERGFPTTMFGTTLIEVIKNGDGALMQRIYHVGSTGSVSIGYIRAYRSGYTWSSWSQLPIGITDSLVNQSGNYAASANAVWQLNKKLQPSSWVDLPPASGWSATRLRYRTIGNLAQVIGVGVKASSGYSSIMTQVPLELRPSETLVFDSTALSSTSEVALQFKLLSNGYIGVFPTNNTNLTTYVNGLYFNVLYVIG